MALELELPSTSKQESILRVYMISVGINNVLFGAFIPLGSRGIPT